LGTFFLFEFEWGSCSQLAPIWSRAWAYFVVIIKTLPALPEKIV